MVYDFDTVVNRYNTNSLKFDMKDKYGKPEDVLPMWVADMDFPVLNEVKEAIHRRADHPVYGYTYAGEEYYNSVMDWMKNRHSYQTEKDWYLVGPGVVFGIAVAIRAFTKPGDGIMINTPVYPQFFSVISKNDRRIVKSPLTYRRLEENQYELNFADIEEKIKSQNVKLYILCSPHNPVGRVWTKQELTTLGTILKKHNVLLVSDEIHMDFVFTGYRHQVFAGIRKEFSDFTITLTAPTKTFNLAGLQIANAIISNPSIRKEYLRELQRTFYMEPNIFAIEAGRAAYSHGVAYMDQLLQYLEENVKLVKEHIHTYLPKVKLSHMEGTYLMWLDFTEYGLPQGEINEKMLRKAKLWLHPGELFGEDGNGFQRFNIAVPRSVLRQSLTQLTEAFS